MPDLKIRNVLLEDLNLISKIESTCFPVQEAAPKSVLKERIEVFPKGFFVAEIDNDIIGFINGGATNKKNIEDDFFKTMDLHLHGGENMVIFGLDVDPRYQRKGHAKELMEHFIVEAKKDGRKKILLTCKQHLIGFYEQFGYVNKGVSESVHGGAKWYDMCLNLAHD